MSKESSIVDAMIRSTAVIGRATGALLAKNSPGKRGGVSTAKSERKAARKARAANRRG